MFTYFADLMGDPPTQSSDHDSLMWVKPQELLNLDWAELDVPVVEHLIEIL
jgi:hypothetical protein